MARPTTLLVVLLSLSTASGAFAQAAPSLAHVSGVTGVAAVLPAADAPVVLSRNVIVVSIDGLRPDAIESAGAKTLQRLLVEGSGTISAQTIMMSRTLPSHASMITGVLPETHGINWNSNEGDKGVVSVPTMFDLAHEAGYRTAAFVSKSKFHHLFREGSLDEARLPSFVPLPASRTVTAAIRYLEHERPNLLFVHIAEPDFLGHRFGWMSLAYRWGVREADDAVGAILEAAAETYGEDGFTIIVTADHGGADHDHGSDSAEDRTIPWISYGRGIRAGQPLSDQVNTMDTAATVLHVLGIRVPEGWDGVPVRQATLGAPTFATDPDLSPSGSP